MRLRIAFVLKGNEADDYARDHLDEISVDGVLWLVWYRCPVAGRQWLRDSPRSALQGGGPAKFRQVDLDEHLLDH